jgi:hypothetical protein
MPELKPLPGYLYAEMDPESLGKYGLLFIPETAGIRKRQSFSGVVVQVNEQPWTMRGLQGRRCLFAGWAGRAFDWQGKQLVRYHLTLREVLAVWYDGEWVPLADEGQGATTVCGESVQRCRSCGTSGEGNMMLDGDGYCIRCHRNAAGDLAEVYRYKTPEGTELKTRFPVRVSDEEAAILEGST